MTNEELMMPRYEVISEDTSNTFHIGDVFKFSNIHPYSGYSYEFNGIMVAPEYFDKYPHLFKRLAWWENRRPEDLPEYVKDDNGVYMVKEWHLELASKVTVFIIDGVHDGYVENAGECPLYSEFLPATIQQYIKYVKTKKNNG